jgi:hypothetical protein
MPHHPWAKTDLSKSLKTKAIDVYGGSGEKRLPDRSSVGGVTA